MPLSFRLALKTKLSLITAQLLTNRNQEGVGLKTAALSATAEKELMRIGVCCLTLKGSFKINMISFFIIIILRYS